MTTPINKDTMLKIYKYGIYYNPANSHYGNNSNVVCDRCYRQGLDVCIGYQSYDLCLKCILEINTESKTQFPYNPIATQMVMTNMEQKQFKTYMMQDQYETFMMQNQFRF